MPPVIGNVVSCLVAVSDEFRVTVEQDRCFELACVLRHSKIAVTMEIYTEIPSAATREALRKLGRWLGE